MRKANTYFSFHEITFKLASLYAVQENKSLIIRKFGEISLPVQKGFW